MSDQGLASDTILTPRLDVRIRKVRGRLLVAADGTTLELSETAGFIFRRVDGVRTIGQIAVQTAHEYEIDVAEALQDVTELLAELLANDLVRRVGPP